MTQRLSRSPATVPGYRKGTKPANAGQVYPPQPFNDDDFMALIYGCSRTSATGLRDRALLSVMYRSGLRISEALSLHVTDLRPEDHAIVVRRGKGGKQRMAYMDDWGWEQMTAWLERRAKLVDPAGGWVFCTIALPDPGGKLGAPQVRTMMKRKGRQAGLTRRCNPHALRHGFAVGLINSGSTLPEVSNLLGHSNVATTNTYVNHVDPSAKVAAVMRRPRPNGATAPDVASWVEQARAAGWVKAEDRERRPGKAGVVAHDQEAVA